LPMSMPIEAKGGMVVSMGCFSGCCGVVLADYPRGGSSRSIPLSDVATRGILPFSPSSGRNLL
jgi:hypothetical protein